MVSNISREGKVTINQKEYSLKDLEKLLEKLVSLFPNQAVVIRGDKEVDYGRIVEILDVCAKTGIWNVSFATIKKEKGE